VRRFDALLALAEEHKRYLIESEGLPAEKLRIIYNGVDTERFRPAASGERLKQRADLGVPADALVIMAVASLKELKRLDLLLAATAPLVRRDANAWIVLVGQGAERARLEALARELGIEQRVLFCGVRNDVNELLRAADVVVLSSRTEAFPNVILEAMATGLPVVSTRVGSVGEMVEPGHSALLVPPEDEAALRNAVEELAGNPARRAEFGARGRKIAEERFRFDTMCAAREALFDELLSGAPLGAR
jgi:glycosyltransferase involved in cell wall biosynthesis